MCCSRCYRLGAIRRAADGSSMTTSSTSTPGSSAELIRPGQLIPSRVRRDATRPRWLGQRLFTSAASPAVALFLLPLAVYHRALTPGWVIGDLDLLFYMVPYRAYLVQAWGAGDWLPLWNSHIFLGAPFLANIQGSPLYPQNFLLALMPVPLGIDWLVAVHVGIAGAGMYLYCLKALRLRRAGSMVAGLVLMFGALMFSHVGHFNLMNTLAWTPWAMLATDRAAVSPTPARLAALSVVIALVILAGHTQLAYYTLLLVMGVGAARLWTIAVRRRLPLQALKTVVLLAGSIGLGVALTAVQLIATLELAGLSIRAGGLTHDAASSYSLPIQGFVGDLLPDYAAEHQSEFATSVGAAVLPLMALALVMRWRRPRVFIWALLGLLGLVVAFGPRAKLYDFLYVLLPGFNSFRVPARALVFATIAAAVLSGYGVLTAQQLAQAWRRPRLRPAVVSASATATVVAAIPIATAWLVLLAGNPQHGPLKVFPPLQVQNLATMAGFAVAATAVLGAGLMWHRAVLGLLPVVVFVDLVLLAGHTYPMNPVPDQVLAAPAMTASLFPHSLDERHLSLVPIDAGFQPASAVPAGLSPIDQAKYEWLLRQEEAQAPNLSLMEGTLDADGYDGGVLPLRSYITFRAPLLPPGGANPPDFMTRLVTSRVQDPGWLDLTGVTTVVTVAGNDPNQSGSNRLVPVAHVGNLVAWRVSGPLPARAHLENGRAAHILSDTGERVVVRLPDGASGRLILADTYYPGWIASVDGRTVSIQRYAGYLRAVDLPPNATEVVFEYRPSWLLPGMLVSGTALLVTLVLLVLTPVRELRARLRR